MIFVPSLETEYVMTHIEPSAKFTQQALDRSNQVISLLNLIIIATLLLLPFDRRLN